jgi:hypothetical protein
MISWAFLSPCAWPPLGLADEDGRLALGLGLEGLDQLRLGLLGREAGDLLELFLLIVDDPVEGLVLFMQGVFLLLEPLLAVLDVALLLDEHVDALFCSPPGAQARLELVQLGLAIRASRSKSAFVFNRLSLAGEPASFLMLSASFLASSTIRTARFSEDCSSFRVIIFRSRYPKAIPAINDAMAMMTGKKSNLCHLLIPDGIGRPMRSIRSFRFNAVE